MGKNFDKNLVGLKKETFDSYLKSTPPPVKGTASKTHTGFENWRRDGVDFNFFIYHKIS
tara:strand:+ start:101 stop:277 length:177 start_codon:yes stop_codon:yes gene_type:complete